ncbi:hydrocephalus-inducing protein homolog, partial [Melopsittacus undulatus]|uniref:hydrocephalus-inducing protein homolog n=1 Tax=Melopsittacus undulatus TaxID=13146 RepID=UPI00146C57F0
MVTVANKSAAPLTFKLRVTSTVPELQEAGVLCLKPSKDLKLKGRGDTCKVEVTFSPKRRMQPFSGEVLLECRGLVRSLCVVRGSCQGSLVSLDQDQLSFGAVVQQSYTCRRVVMRNAGDTRVRFMWDVESFKPDFSISPTKGYISPGMDVPLVVTFRPSKLSQAVQYEGLRCFIQGSEALRLTLAGSCVEAPGPKELKATWSRPEKPVYFRTRLGSRQTITTKIRHFAQQKTEYLVQTDCADFQTAKSISAAPASAGGSDLSVEVTFEPCHLGEAKATLQLSSALVGMKHPGFTVRAPEVLRAKSSTTITVSFAGGPAPVTSRLVVSCPGAPGSTTSGACPPPA